MLIYIVFIILFSFLIFSICLFCLFKKNIIIENLYLIIPIICIGLWAFYSLLQADFNPSTNDFEVFYRAGRQIFINPAKLYDVSGFVYMPSFAILFSVSISLFPFYIAYNIFFIINFILGALTIREYNKILILMGIKEKIYRFMFLIIISAGPFVYFQFLIIQSKYILFLILLFIIRREIQDRNKDIKDLKYYLVVYGLFVLAIGMAPYFIFFLLIYMFQDVPRNEIFKNENIKKYCIVISMFLTQNFLFIIYPSQFFIFLDGFNFPHRRREGIRLIYLKYLFQVSFHYMAFLTILFTIILSIISLILMFNNKLQIEEKFGFFSIAYILMGVYSFQVYLFLLLFSLVLLLFVPHLNQNMKGIEFVKSNKIVLIGLFSIIGIFVVASNFIIFKLFPRLAIYPLTIFFNFMWIFFLSIMMISLIKLYLKRDFFLVK